MDHTSPDSFKEQGLALWIRPIGPDAGINVGRGSEFILVREEDEKVHVGKSAFLKFNDVHVGNNPTKNTIL